MKTSSSSIRKFLVVVLAFYFGILAVVLVGLLISGKLAIDNVGNILLYLGAAIFILGFLFMGAADRREAEAASRSPRIRSDAQFMKWRKQERPVKFVTWAIILAAGLMAVTGYILLYLVNLG